MSGLRKSDGGGLMGSGNHRDSLLVAARVLAGRDWERPRDIQHARHLAHAGYNRNQIALALGWDVVPAAANRRLRKYNIVPRNVSDRAHMGEITTLQQAVDFSSYRCRELRAAQ